MNGFYLGLIREYTLISVYFQNISLRFAVIFALLLILELYKCSFVITEDGISLDLAFGRSGVLLGGLLEKSWSLNNDDGNFQGVLNCMGKLHRKQVLIVPLMALRHSRPNQEHWNKSFDLIQIILTGLVFKKGTDLVSVSVEISKDVWVGTQKNGLSS